MPDATPLNYSGRDFTATFERLLGNLQIAVPELTDLNHSDAGVALLRLLAREVDQLNFYTDEVFAEGFITSAKFKQSLIDLGKVVDVMPKLASAATTSVLLSRTTNPVYELEDVVVPRGTALSRSDGVVFSTVDSVTIPALDPSVSVDVIQGVEISLTIEPSDFVLFDEMGCAKYNLGQNVAAGTVVVTHNDGNIVWSEVDSFYRSSQLDYHYKLELFADDFNGLTDTVFLILGNGTNGRGVPVTDMAVSFIQTSGDSGNCGANTIVVPDFSWAQYFNCSNAIAATGGAVAESIESFRQRIPMVVRTQRRAVTTEDYIALVESIPGVKDCHCVDRNTDEAFPHNYVVLYIIPEGGGVISSALRSTILAELQEWGHLGAWAGRYILREPDSVSVPVTCRVGVSTGYSVSSVLSAVRTAISGEFSLDKLSISTSLTYSTLFNSVLAVDGVSWVEFSEPVSTVTAAYSEILAAGTITVTQGF